MEHQASSTRVLHIGKFYPPFAGGIETFLRDLMRAQQRRGDVPGAIVHHTQSWQACRREEMEGVNVWRISTLGKALFTPISPSFAWRLGQTIREFRPDVLHLHVPNVSAFWALTSRCARRLPWVVQWQSDVIASSYNRRLAAAYRIYRVAEQRLLARADAVIVSSPPYLESSQPLAPWRHKCRVIPLGLDRRRLPDPTVEMLQWPNLTWKTQRSRVLALGRLSYYKGFDLLLHAIAAAPEVQLCLVGEGQQEEMLRSMIAVLNLADRVQMLGHIADAQAQALLATCDVLCLPSIERTEAFGLVLLEAMRYGRAVIASDIPGSGPGWIVRHGETGLLVPPGDVRQLAVALTRLSNAPELRRALGESGAARFEADFSIERVAEQTAALYDSLLDASKERSR